MVTLNARHANLVAHIQSKIAVLWEKRVAPSVKPFDVCYICAQASAQSTCRLLEFGQLPLEDGVCLNNFRVYFLIRKIRQ
jgi:hypothetical protein